MIQHNQNKFENMQKLFTILIMKKMLKIDDF